MDKFVVPMSRQTKRAMLYTLAFLLIMHGFRFVSLGFSHDAGDGQPGDAAHRGRDDLDPGDHQRDE